MRHPRLRPPPSLRAALLPRALVLALVALATSQAPSPHASHAQAQAPATALDFELVDHLGGAVTGIAAYGERGYMTRGLRLEVLDLADPRAPRVIGRSDPMPGLFVAEAAAEGRAYLVERVRDRRRPEIELDRLHVFDVSDPARPDPRGQLALGKGELSSFVVIGTTLFAAAREQGIRVIDLRDADRPTEAGFLRTRGEAVTVAGEDTRLVSYGTGIAKKSRLEIWARDAAPLESLRIGSLELDAELGPVGLRGDHAIVASRSEVLAVDLAEPSAPRLRSRIRLYFGDSISFTPDRVFVRTYYQAVRDTPRLVEIDLSALPEMRIVSERALTRSYPMIAQQDTILAADAAFGLRIFSPTGPDATLEELPRLPTIGQPTGIELQGDRAYVADWDAELWVLDISEPARPQPLGRAELSYGWTEGLLDFQTGAVAVRGDQAYVARHPYHFTDGGLHVVDVSDPTAPFQRSVWEPWLTPALEGETLYSATNRYQPALMGDRLWLAGRPQLTQLDVSDPDAPAFTQYVGDGNASSFASGLAVADGELWLAFPRYGLRRFDVSDPGEMRLLETIRTAGPPEDVALLEEHILVADGEAGARVLERASRQAMLQLDGLHASRIRVEGDTAFVTGYEGQDRRDGIWALDISDPGRTRVRGHHALTTEWSDMDAAHVAAAGDHLYATSKAYGLAILALREGAPLPAPTQGPSITPLPTREPTPTRGSQITPLPTRTRSPGATSTPAWRGAETAYLPVALR